jgi:hypothetical protein
MAAHGATMRGKIGVLNPGMPGSDVERLRGRIGKRAANGWKGMWHPRRAASHEPLNPSVVTALIPNLAVSADLEEGAATNQRIAKTESTLEAAEKSAALAVRTTG